MPLSNKTATSAPTLQEQSHATYTPEEIKYLDDYMADKRNLVSYETELSLNYLSRFRRSKHPKSSDLEYAIVLLTKARDSLQKAGLW